MKFSLNKKGISLIVLIITIIVIIILAGTVILNLTSNNPMTSAKSAAFKNNLSNYGDELNMYLNAKYATTNGDFDVSTLNGTTGDGLKSIISSMKDSDKDNLKIQDGKIVYTNLSIDKSNEYTWAESINMTDTNIVNSTSDLWTINQIGMLTAYKGSDLATMTDIVIPNYIDGKPVLTVISGFLNGANSLKTVKISKGITKIGNVAFAGLSSLTNVIIPDTVILIDMNAFVNCINLTDVSIPSSVQTIGYGAFYLCKSIKSIEIENGTTIIDLYAFGYCTNLEKITIPASVTTIDSTAFYNCTALTTILIDKPSGSITGSPWSSSATPTWTN